MIKRYNSTTQELSLLSIGTNVLIQDSMNKHRWNKPRSIADVDNTKYIIRIDGSDLVVTRNRGLINPVHVEPYVTADLLNPCVSGDYSMSLNQSGSVDVAKNLCLNQHGSLTEAV